MTKSRRMPIDILRARETMLWEAILTWQGRWIFGLAVANAGALLAVAGFIVSDLSAPTVSLVFPSAWLFAAGLLVAGVLPAVDLMRMLEKKREVAAHIADIEQGHEIEETVGGRVSWGEWALEAVPGICFAAGLLYPLIALSLRYLSTGEFSLS